MAFARGEDAEEDGGGVAAAAAADEEPVFPAQGDATQRPLGYVVVNRQRAERGEETQVIPLVEGVVHRLAPGALGQRVTLLLVQEVTQGSCDRPNCNRTSSKNKKVRNPVPKHPDSRIVAQAGEEVYDAASQVRKSLHGGTIPEIGWKKQSC